ncbi:MAG: VCBS repeat-containing protein [Candidatus Eisenbacteria bacterium]|nr:VCBS repeat-containing protein [Candidatus Eisenbacteria bacterium]
MNPNPLRCLAFLVPLALVCGLATGRSAMAACASALGFWSNTGYSAGAPVSMPLLHDMNGDGRLDFVLSSPDSHFVKIAMGSLPLPADTRWSPADAMKIRLSVAPAQTVAADFNADGVSDLAIGSSQGAAVFVALGTMSDTSWAFGAPLSLEAPQLGAMDHIAAADMNEDGILDLVAAGAHGAGVFLGQGAYGIGDGTFALAEQYPGFMLLSHLAVADFNGDGHLDVAGAHTGEPSLSFAFGTGTGQLGLPASFNLLYWPTALTQADLSADGRPDLAVGTQHGVLLLLNATVVGGTQPSFQVLDQTQGGTRPWITQIVSQDVNLDGAPDVLALRGDGLFSEFRGARNGGTYSISSTFEVYTGAAMNGLALGDLDGDEMVDVVSSNAVYRSCGYMFGNCSAAAAGRLRLAKVVHGEGQILLSPAGPDYPVATQVQVTAVPGPGMVFAGWSGAATGDSLVTSVSMAADAAVHGWFAPARNEVSTQVDGQGSVTRSIALPRVPEGSSVFLKATASSGWYFTGWSGDVTSLASGVNLHPARAMALVAHFAPIPVALNTIVWPAGAGTVIRSPDAAAYPPSSWVTLTALPQTGWHFTGWSGAMSGIANPSSLSLTANASVTASFAINSYAVTTQVAGSGTVSRSPSPGPYSHGTVVRFSAAPAANYFFKGWSGDTTVATSVFSMAITRPMNLQATFEPNPLLRPRIAAVRDVARDEGGRIRVSWLPTLLDLPPHDGGQDVSDYVVYLALPGSPAWDSVGVTPAAALEGYAMTLVTPMDSTSAGNPRTRVFVRARSLDRTRWWDSAVDSGYSVDNLAPASVTGVQAQATPGGISLRWTASEAPDLAGYRVYRGTNPGFAPEASTRVAAVGPAATSIELSGRPDLSSYVKLTAEDVHGNESEPLLLTPGTLGVAHAAALFALLPPRPNPSRGELGVEFTLAREGETWIDVLDVGGRVVRHVALGPLAPGTHRIPLSPSQPLPAGLYFLRLSQGTQRALCRVAIIP